MLVWLKRVFHGSPFFFDRGLFPKYLFSHGIVVILTALVVAIVSFTVSKDEMERYARASAQTIMEQTGLLLEKNERDLQKNLVAQLEQAGIYKLIREGAPSRSQAARVALEHQFAVMMSTNTWMRSVLLTTPLGPEVFLSADGKDTDAKTIRTFEPLAVESLHGRAYWYVDDDGSPFFCKVLYDLQTSARLGTLAVGMDSRFFDSLSPIVKNSGLGSFFVLSTDAHHLIFHTKSSQGALRKVMSWVWGQEEFESRFRSEGIPYLAMSLVSENQEWQIINVISSDELTALSSRTGILILESALGALAAALALAFFLVRGEVGKIKTLVSHARRIGRGDFRLSTGVDSRDELGELDSEIGSMASQIEELIEKVASERSQKAEAELRALGFEYNALQSRINPHFISNTLEMINSAAKLNGVPQIGEVACLLGDLMKASIRRRENLLSLEDELGHCRIYLRIQELLLESRLNVSYDIPADMLKLKVPNLILQPIIENAVIHGIEPKVGNSTISISASREGGDMRLTVSDDGVGIESDRLAGLLSPGPSSTTKIGLESVDKRIEILFGRPYGLSIDSRFGEGTIVALRMPAIEDEP